ncbi:MAG TPA: TlpA disulfide reductase family protein [Acidobacteriota bacterium]|nr:TlpA disulfide reductase family protein [Acidobacteriota bacterium]
MLLESLTSEVPFYAPQTGSGHEISAHLFRITFGREKAGFKEQLCFYQRTEIARLSGAVLTLKAATRLPEGASLPAFSARTVDGKPAVIEFGADQPVRVFYYFSRQCPWCIRNVENIQTLARSVGGNYRFLGLSTQQDPEAAPRHELDFPVLVDMPEFVMESYKLGGTPRTIVVSGDGEVIKAWSGAYAAGLKAEIEAYFGVELPGLSPPSL